MGIWTGRSIGVIQTRNKYPKEFHAWVKEKDLMFINGIWQIFHDEEKDWTPLADTIEELYQIYLKEKEKEN